MEEVRIKIHNNLPYDIVFDTIQDLLFDSIAEEDKFAVWRFSNPTLDFDYYITYRKGKTKTFEAWKIQSNTTE